MLHLKTFSLLGCVLLGMSLGGCGLRPLYGPPSSSKGQETSNSEEALSAIRVNLIPDRKGQLLRNNLISLLTPKGQPRKPLYILKVTLDENTQALGILKDATFSRSQMTYTATFQLLEFSTKKPLFTNSTFVVSNYNVITANEFATIISAGDVQDRSLVLLAEQIMRELATYFFTRSKETESIVPPAKKHLQNSAEQS